MDVHEFKAWLHLVQNADELKTVKKISRAKGAEVHKLESECIHVSYSKPKAKDTAEPLLHRWDANLERHDGKNGIRTEEKRKWVYESQCMHVLSWSHLYYAMQLISTSYLNIHHLFVHINNCIYVHTSLFAICITIGIAFVCLFVIWRKIMFCYVINWAFSFFHSQYISVQTGTKDKCFQADYLALTGGEWMILYKRRKQVFLSQPYSLLFSTFSHISFVISVRFIRHFFMFLSPSVFLSLIISSN